EQSSGIDVMSLLHRQGCLWLFQICLPLLMISELLQQHVLHQYAKVRLCANRCITESTNLAMIHLLFALLYRKILSVKLPLPFHSPMFFYFYNANIRQVLERSICLLIFLK